jgi:hypothetical protein
MMGMRAMLPVAAMLASISVNLSSAPVASPDVKWLEQAYGRPVNAVRIRAFAGE